MLYLKLAVPFLIFVLSLANLALEHKWKDRRTRAYRYGRRVLVGIVIVLAFVSAVVVYFDHNSRVQLNDQIQALQTQARIAEQKIGEVKQKAELLENISIVQLRMAQYHASLDEPIISMQLQLPLKQKISFSEIIPFVFFYELFDLSKLWFQREPNEFYYVRYVVRPGGFIHEPLNIPAASYLIERSLNDTIRNTLHFLDCREQIQEIEVPFIDERPTYTIARDLHYSGIRISLSKNLLNLVTHIRLIVNGILIFDKMVQPENWIEVHQSWMGKDPTAILWIPKSDAIDQARDVIDLYANIPRYFQCVPLDVIGQKVVMQGRPDVDITGRPLR